MHLPQLKAGDQVRQPSLKQREQPNITSLCIKLARTSQYVDVFINTPYFQL